MTTKKITYSEFIHYGLKQGYLLSKSSKIYIDKMLSKNGLSSSVIEVGEYPANANEFRRVFRSEQALKLFCNLYKVFLNDVKQKINVANLPNGLVKVTPSPIIQRQQEIKLMKIILNKKIRSNILLVGAAGVGKTVLVEALSAYFPIVKIDTVELIAGSEYRGVFEKRLRQIVDYIIDHNLIAFVDEIHALYHLGQAEGGISALNILKPYLSSGKLSLIGATTNEECKILTQDKAFMRRFTLISLENISISDILENADDLTKNFPTNISRKVYEKLLSVVQKKASPSRYLDSFIDLCDTICAAAVQMKLSEVNDDNFYKFDWILERMDEGARKITFNK